MIRCSVCGAMHCNDEPRCLTCAEAGLRPSDRDRKRAKGKLPRLHRSAGWNLAEKIEREMLVQSRTIYLP